ncbi:MAG: CotH kinase family protein [Clostridia bacterium]|nr:CotH kinase family protein [Clostridia bacterium]
MHRLILPILILIFCCSLVLPSCTQTAASASQQEVQPLGLFDCTEDDAAQLTAALTETDMLPTLRASVPGTDTRHELPAAYADKTPAYYLSLDMAQSGWDSVSLSAAGCDIYLVSDTPLPEKSELLSSGQMLTLLFCGERYYSYANLICTGLPVLQIDLYDAETGKTTTATAVDRTAVPMYFSYYDGADPAGGTVASASSAGKIRLRGGTSAKYDKHSFKISFYDDITLTDQNNLSLCGLRSDDDWILNAMYQEETKIRDMLAYDLWEDIGADYYGDGTFLGTRMRYVELIFGGRYWGLYGLCEPEDAKQFGISETNPGCVYKVASWVVPTVDELQETIRNDLDRVADVELKYPNPADSYRDAWKPFLDYVEVTYESADFYFDKTADTLLDQKNLADLWIFLNITSARDNRWKNLYLTYREDNGKLVMAPWDCDITFGLSWQEGDWESLHLYHEQYAFYEIQDMPVLARYIELNTGEFQKTLSDRWNALRGDWLSAEEIISRARAFRARLEDSGALTRNRRRWPGSGDTVTLSFLEEYVNFRIPYIDDYIASLTAD